MSFIFNASLSDCCFVFSNLMLPVKDEENLLMAEKKYIRMVGPCPRVKISQSGGTRGSYPSQVNSWNKLKVQSGIKTQAGILQVPLLLDVSGGPWTKEEHRTFLEGLEKLGKGDWRGILRNFVMTRTPTQVASHAQKYFLRHTMFNNKKRRSSLFDMAINDVAPTSDTGPALSQMRTNEIPEVTNLRLQDNYVVMIKESTERGWFEEYSSVHSQKQLVCQKQSS